MVNACGSFAVMFPTDFIPLPISPDTGITRGLMPTCQAAFLSIFLFAAQFPGPPGCDINTRERKVTGIIHRRLLGFVYQRHRGLLQSVLSNKHRKRRWHRQKLGRFEQLEHRHFILEVFFLYILFLPELPLLSHSVY